MIFELLFGRLPFCPPTTDPALPDGEQIKLVKTLTEKNIRDLRYEFPRLPLGASYPEAKDLFRRIFVKPDDRITLAEME
jgi:hypothetical protein